MNKNRNNRRSLAARPLCLAMLGGFVSMGSGCASRGITADPVYYPLSGAPARVVHLKSFNRIDDIVAIEHTFIETIRGNRFISRIENAAGIATSGDNLFVCDTEQAVVHVWNLKNGDTYRLGQSGDVRLETPVDVAIAEDGSVLVADTGRGEVVAFSSDGAEPQRLRPPGNARFQPVALAAAGNTLYVADLGSASIVAFDIDAGSVESTFTLSDKAGDAVMPMGVAVGPTGELFVTDAMGGRVLVLSSGGELVRTMSQRGNRLGDMGHPKHIDVSDDGTVFIADAEFAHVHLFNTGGELLMLVGGAEDRTGGTPMPFGVAVIASSATLQQLVPADFEASYFVVVTNSLGSKRINLFAVGNRQ